jgi:signal transduction histidine kinase/HAMP domain-containing protein
VQLLSSSLAPWLGVVFVGAWLRWPTPWLLVAAGAAALIWIRSPRPWSKLQAIGVTILIAALPAGFLAHADLYRYGPGWTAYWTDRQAEVEGRLDAELGELIELGNRAADLASADADSLRGTELDRAVRDIRQATTMAGLAVYGPDGRLVSWDGRHRGLVPTHVIRGTQRLAYGESPLFSYVYITAPVARTGGTVVAAALLRAELPPALPGDGDDFAARFRRDVGESISIFASHREVAEPIAWNYVLDGRPLFGLAVVRPTQAERFGEALAEWSRVLAVLVAGAWLFLAVGGHGRSLQLPFAGATLLLLAGLMPFESLMGGPGFQSSAQFLLPGAVAVPLTRMLALSLAGVFVAGLLRPRHRGWWPPVTAALLVGLGFPLVERLLRNGVPTHVLAGAEPEFILFQTTLAVVLGLAAYVSLRVVRLRRGRPGAGAALLAGLLILPLMVAYSVVWVRQIGPLPALAGALWALPAGLMAYGLDRGRRGWRALPRWAMAAVLGASAALSAGWSGRIEARIGEADVRMASLGSQVDSYLEFLLHRFGTSARSLDQEGAEEVEILYRGWVTSGLAERGVPLWLTVWTPGNLPREEFRIGVEDARPGVADDYLSAARATDTVAIYSFAQADANYVAVVPMREGYVATAVVPARPSAAGVSPLSALFAGDAGTEDPLVLVPLLEGDVPNARETPEWIPTTDGWTAEALLPTPQQPYHAHYTVAIPGPLVLAARGTLLFVLNVTTFLLVWGAGRTLARGLRPPFHGWRVVVTSFRARITVALFAFFLLSNAIFGTLAFQALSTATERASETLAERITEDAAGWYNEVQGAMELLARRVGGDLLEYRDGALREGSVEELVRLGIYDGWVPLDVFQLLSRGEAVRTSRLSSLGGLSYATAFRRLPDGDLLAAPVSLQTGATAVRRREVVDLLGFAAVVGAVLSLGLALLVGRALARPLLTLQVASERVGSGNLRVRLPEDRTDEFGSVFVAFNRMVARLRGARRDLVRTTRRTEAIVEEAATGVMALDGAGRVTLVNPRAEAFLGREIAIGKPLQEDGGPADELVRWVHLYFRDGVREGGTELQFGDRRIRVRARRIERRGPLGGAVLSLEDVTDELRTERILAWGEMAQQVAHEVKNPLTPIKLSVQHIRRAWDDRRGDFSTILSKNIQAILAEIDRLASISRSFSSFAAPRAAGADPLEPVDLRTMVDDTLALYDTGQGGMSFTGAVPALPPVTARRSEIKEVLVNLLENARGAVAADGSVRVEAARVGQDVELRVVDDGAGIAPELLPRIFEPHFSTRSGGTGLGLAIVRRLVESWGGTVDIESHPGEGTIVRVRLVSWKNGEPDAAESVGPGEVDDGASGKPPPEGSPR